MAAKLFISYSHKDDKFRKRFETALVQMKRSGHVTMWSDRKILPGDKWENEIDQNLESADLIVCLVSPDFLSSEYCISKELRRALERDSNGTAKVIPIILRPCDWNSSPLAKIQAVPLDARPISKWPNQDEAWLDVINRIRNLTSEPTVLAPSSAEIIRHQVPLYTQVLTDETQSWLNDTEVEFLHRHTGRVELSDIFICPDLKKLLLDVDAKRAATVTHCDEITKSPGYTLILGDEQSGKTSLAKYYYRSLLERGWYPVILDGSEVNNANVSECAGKAVKRQYRDQFWSSVSASDKQAIIIDDYSEVRLNRKYLAKFTQTVCDKYALAILFAVDPFKYVVPDIGVLAGFNHYEILPFGNAKRAALIEKWVSIGVAEQIDENVLYESTDTLKVHLDSFVNRNIVPAKPLYLLTILQTFETVKPSRIELTSYGHCYQFLIQKSLESISIKHTEIDSYLNVLTELARAVFENNGKGLTEEQLDEFFRRYQQKYLSVDRARIIDDLKRCKILCDLQGTLNFKYRFIYYFYTAKNFAEQLSRSDESKSIIRQLLSHLHKEDCANIIIFITHHTRDPWILDEIQMCMMDLFQEEKEARLESKELDFLTDFLASIPKLVIEQREIESERKKAYETKDAADEARREFDQNADKLEPTDVLAKINKVFRGIELIGQIVRNRYGSLEREALQSDVSEILCVRSGYSRFQFNDAVNRSPKTMAN